MHRFATVLLALFGACSLPLGVRAEGNPEAVLLKRFEAASAAGAQRARAAVSAAIDEARQHEQKSPDRTVRLLRDLQERVENDPATPRVERRKLTGLVQQHIDAVIERALLRLPRTTDNVVREYRDADDGPRSRLPQAEARMLFSNGAQFDGLVHGVGGQGVRCTLQGQRLLIPGWLMPAIEVRQGCYYFDYTLHGYIYVDREQCAAAQKAWHSGRIGLGLTPSRAGQMPIWDALADRFTMHGDHLIALWRHQRPKDEICGCVEQNMPELVWSCRNPKLDREIEHLLPGSSGKTKRAVRSLIAQHADKTTNWQHSKAQTLALLMPRIRASVRDLTTMQEERLGDFILGKAEAELQRRPL